MTKSMTMNTKILPKDFCDLSLASIYFERKYCLKKKIKKMKKQLIFKLIKRFFFSVKFDKCSRDHLFSHSFSL